jgi:predicted permease
MVADLFRELRQAVRTMARAPGYTAVAVATLALGSGAATAIFSLLDRVVFQPLPYPEAERLVRLKSLVPGVDPGAEWQLASAEYFYFGEQSRTIERLGAYQRDGTNIETPSGPQRAALAVVSAGALELIGARAAAGRLIDENDDAPGRPPVVMLSHGFWRREFGGERDVVGRTIRLSGYPHEVIGVTAEGVTLPQEPGGEPDIEPDLWLPMRLDPAGPFYNSHVIPMFARLRAGVTLEQAQAELDRLTARLPEVYPAVYSRRFFERYGFRTKAYALKSYIVGEAARNLWILFGAVSLVLAIACANVANLFLVRVEGRRRELAIRTALGAPRGAIASHLLAESMVLSFAGGVLALPIAMAGVSGALRLAPESLPRMPSPTIDGSVLLFALALSTLVALVLALFPLARLGGPRYAGSLAEGGRSLTAGRERQRVRAALVVTQVALALVLLVGASLLLESFRRLRAADPGIEPDGVLVAELLLPTATYPDPAAMWQFYRAALERIRAVPGVTAAGMSTTIPFGGGYGCTVQGFEDRAVYDRLAAADVTTCAGQEPTTPGYFESVGIPLIRGRTFTNADNDQPDSGVVIVSKAFADRFWPGEDPIGKGVAPGGRAEGPFYRVVGIVGDVYSSSVTEEPAVAIYYPIVPIPRSSGFWPSAINLTVRTGSNEPMAVLPAIRRAITDIDPAMPLANVMTMSSIVSRSMARTTFVMALLGSAAAAALALAAIGLFGVISYIVTHRTNEIGVRIALGARPPQVENMVMRASLALIGGGIAIGLAGAIAATRVLQSLLYGVPATSPLAYLASVTLLTAVGTAATLIPARRAARLDPIRALRTE